MRGFLVCRGVLCRGIGLVQDEMGRVVGVLQDVEAAVAGLGDRFTL